LPLVVQGRTPLERPHARASGPLGGDRRSHSRHGGRRQPLLL